MNIREKYSLRCVSVRLTRLLDCSRRTCTSVMVHMPATWHKSSLSMPMLHDGHHNPLCLSARDRHIPSQPQWPPDFHATPAHHGEGPTTKMLIRRALHLQGLGSDGGAGASKLPKRGRRAAPARAGRSARSRPRVRLYWGRPPSTCRASAPSPSSP